jgi:class 3 adenylate cyclase/tetratricopeptide (TPR) repeat protein
LANEVGPQRGAEELTSHLDVIFGAVIEELYRFGGEVVYFSGDAITCWIDGDDGRHGAACGLAMQRAMDRCGLVCTPGGTEIQLAIKVAVVVGAASRFVVGDPAIQRIEVLAGSIIDALAAAEQHAQPGDVVLHRSALASLGSAVTVSEVRADGEVAVLDVLAVEVAARSDDPADDDTGRLGEETIRRWLLPVVYERLTTGRGEFVAELRAAYPVFVRFDGFDHDHDPTADQRLDDFVRMGQQVFDRHGGNLLQLTIGDKGAYLYGVFGSPVTHENDAMRAVAAALDLRSRSGTDAGIQIGIAHGRLRSGTYGHPQRRTFTCLGDAVNLAARLMAGAPPGAIHVADAVQQAAGSTFVWHSLGPRKMKGKVAPIEVFELLGQRRAPVVHARRYPLPIVGRDRELQALDDARRRSASGGGEVVAVIADAGQGKSRLLAEAIRRWRDDGVLVVVGEGQSLTSSYQLWREVWQTLLGVGEHEDDPRAVLHDVEVALRSIDPALPARAPLLGPVLGVALPDNALTATFDAKLRKTSLEALLVTVLQAIAARDPLVVVLEDAHWIDALSMDLLAVVLRELSTSPVLLVVAHRPGAELGLADGSPCTEIVLADLTPEAAAEVVDAKCRQLFDRPAGPALVARVSERAGGNPFYIEELLHYLRHLGVDPADAAAVAGAELPHSLHALVLSRVDGLAENPRRTLKVASVVGSQFTSQVLEGSYPDLGAADHIGSVLHGLRQVDLVVPDPFDDDTWLFHHSLIREVAYESLPFAMRAELHERVAVHLETTAPDLDRLAHHYWHSDNLSKKRTYLSLAGAASQAAYANEAAIGYFERLSGLVEGAARAEVLVKLGRVLELTGEWSRAETVMHEARVDAEAAGDTRVVAGCDAALAEVARKQGRYDDATAFLDRARSGFEAIGDAPGLGQVLHVTGTLAAQRGNYTAARASYRESLTIREALDDRSAVASLLSNLGVVAEYEGDLDACRAFHEQALAVRRGIGDRWAIAVSLTNLGMAAVLQRRYDDAQSLFQEALRLNAEVGDPWMVAISHHNLGNALRGLGRLDEADREYTTAMDAYRRHDDQWAIAFLLEDQAMLAAGMGNHERALRLAGAADRVREDSGASRAPAQAAELDEALATSVASLGEEVAVAVRAVGRAEGMDEALPAS